MSVISPLD